MGRCDSFSMAVELRGYPMPHVEVPPSEPCPTLVKLRSLGKPTETHITVR